LSTLNSGLNYFKQNDRLYVLQVSTEAESNVNLNNCKHFENYHFDIFTFDLILKLWLYTFTNVNKTNYTTVFDFK